MAGLGLAIDPRSAALPPMLRTDPVALPQEPVAPPTENASPSAPVAPPVATNPISVTPTVDAVKNASPSDIVNNAIDSGNVQTLQNFAQQNANTPAGQASDYLAKAFDKGYKDAVQFVGDMSTPEGRQRALETYKKDPVRYGDALMAFATGNKEAAFNIITGGQVKSEVRYLPDSGRAVEVKTNALGKVVSVRDLTSNTIIPEHEYGALGGSLDKLENTISWKNKLDNRKYNLDQFQAANKANNAIETASNAISPLVDEKLDIYKYFSTKPGMTKQDRMNILGIASAQASVANSWQRTQQILDQFTSGKGASVSADDKKMFEGVLGPKGFSINGKNEIVDSSGQKVDYGKLKQAMGTESLNTSLDNSYSQQQANLVAYRQAGLLSNEDFTKLQRALDLDSQIQKVKADVATRHGVPLFTVPTQNADMLDQAHRPLAQSYQEKFNIDAVNLFNKWKDQQIKLAKSADPNFVPEPGQLERAFSNTDLYKNLQKNYAGQMKSAINAPYIEGTSSTGLPNASNAANNPSAPLPKNLPQIESPSKEGQAEMQAADKALKDAQAAKKAEQDKANKLRDLHNKYTK